MTDPDEHSSYTTYTLYLWVNGWVNVYSTSDPNEAYEELERRWRHFPDNMYRLISHVTTVTSAEVAIRGPGR